MTHGGSITLLVTFERNPVPGALVTVNNEEVGNRDEDGGISFAVPDEEELKIKAVLGNWKESLKLT